MAEKKVSTMFIPIRPVAKGRPRATKTGHIYTPQTTRDFEESIAQVYQLQRGKFFGESPVAVQMEFSKVGVELTIIELAPSLPIDWKGQLQGDIDNYQKAILDALNGIAYNDDKQIVDLHATKGWNR